MRRPNILALAMIVLISQYTGWGTLSTNGPATTAHAAGLPSLPVGWPTTMQLGLDDGPGGAAALAATAPFGFRYKYLAGGVNTGGGWATWNTNGDFAKYYIQDSVAANITPVFTYYMLYQSQPGGGAGNLNNLNNAATMAAYYADIVLFLKKAAAFPSTRVVLQVEPDLWGFVQQAASGDNAAQVPAKVASSGVADLNGLPNTAAGFAQALVRLRDLYAPNVVLGYHVSIWGTGTDITVADPSDAAVDALAARAAAFYRSLGASFDLAFAEFLDRDAGFYQLVYGDGGQHWFNAADFARHARFLAGFVDGAQKRVVLWQIPLGNTRMRAQNNTWNHYQDNRVEWLLDEPGRTHLEAYRAAGVVAFLFGRGADGVTCACDAQGDGVTNPAPINGNTQMSLSADDDGGFFRQKAKEYYAAGAIPVGGGTTTTDTISPSISVVQANGVSSSGATIGWTTNEPSDSQVDYGTGSGYGSSTTLVTTKVTSHSATLAGLTAGTTYHYLVKSRDAAGNLATSGDFTFTTTALADTTAPTISAVQVSSVTANGATVGWTTNESSDSQVGYGTSSGYGASTTLVTTKVTNHSATLAGLTAGTTYHYQVKSYQVKSRDAAGNLAMSGDFTFTTTATTSTPTFTSSVTASPKSVARGKSVTITTTVQAATAGTDLIDIEVYSPNGARVYQKAYDQQAFTAGQSRTYTVSWSVPTSAAVGQYVVKVGVFKAGWGTLYHWNNAATKFTVS